MQPKFRKNGKAYQEINYIADFKIYNKDGSVEIIDIKGFETTDFRLKKKMFEYKYPELTLVCLTYVKKYGGWIETDKLKKIRKENKKKNKEEKK